MQGMHQTRNFWLGLDEERRWLDEEGRRLEENRRRLDEEERRLDEERCWLEDERYRFDEEERWVDEDWPWLNEEGRQLDEEGRRLEEERCRLNEERRQLNEERRRLNEERRWFNDTGRWLDDTGHWLDEERRRLQEERCRREEERRWLDEEGCWLEEEGRWFDEERRWLDEEGLQLEEERRRLDEEGRWFDEEGRWLEEERHRLDEEGCRLDEKGNGLEEAMYWLDEEGCWLDEERRRLDEKGHGLEEESRWLGHWLDQKGRRLEEERHRLDEEGCRLDEEGRQLDEEGHRLEEERRRLGEKGRWLDEERCQLEEERRGFGRWLDQEGRQLEEERHWLDEEGSRLLVKAAIDRAMETVKARRLNPSCRCADCESKFVHRRTAFEDKVQILFNEHYELAQYTLNQQYLSSDGTLLLPSRDRVPGLFPDSIEYDDLGNIVSIAGYSHPANFSPRDLDDEEKRERSSRSRGARGEKDADGDMVQIGVEAHVRSLSAILTVADDLLRNNHAQHSSDILEEQHYRVKEELAEFRLREESRRMFIIVAARMFGKQVFHHPKYVTQERQLQLLREIKDEHKLKEAKNREKRPKKAEQQAVQRVVEAAVALVEYKQHRRLRKARDFLRTLMEQGFVTRLPKEKENAQATTVLPEDLVSRWRRATLLLLPSYFSTPDLVTRTLPSHLRMNIARYTVARSLEEATSDPDYERVQKQVQEEWLKVGGLLVGLAALETAAFALAPGSVFSIDKVARIAVSGSSISTGAGLLCDIYLLLRFSLASVAVFKHRAQDKYEVRENGSVSRTQSYLFFALAARLPLLLAMVSIFFIAVLLADVAYKISPLVVLAIVGLTGIILYLEYICWVLIWMVFGLSKVLGWLVFGLSTAGTWPISTFTYVTGRTRGLWR